MIERLILAFVLGAAYEASESPSWYARIDPQRNPELWAARRRINMHANLRDAFVMDAFAVEAALAN